MRKHGRKMGADVTEQVRRERKKTEVTKGRNYKAEKLKRPNIKEKKTEFS